MNGPFFDPDDLQGTFSMLDPSPLFGVVPGVVPVGAFPFALRGAGLGKMGRSLAVVVLADEVDAGEDLDEVFDRGEGPETSGDGVSRGMLGGIYKQEMLTLRELVCVLGQRITRREMRAWMIESVRADEWSGG